LVIIPAAAGKSFAGRISTPNAMESAATNTRRVRYSAPFRKRFAFTKHTPILRQPELTRYGGHSDLTLRICPVIPEPFVFGTEKWALRQL
jgi:hypothetical protein